VDRRGVEDQLPEVGDLGADLRHAVDEPGLAVALDDLEVVAGRRLLPAVGDDDPDAREDRAEGHHAGGEEVHLRPHPVPAEDEHRQEAALEEEGEDALGGQGGAEHVADVARVGGPVRAELELHDDAARDADREVQREDPGPEPLRLPVDGVPGPEVLPSQVDEHHPHADGERRKEVVEHHGEGELDAREENDVFHARAPYLGGVSPDNLATPGRDGKKGVIPGVDRSGGALVGAVPPLRHGSAGPARCRPPQPPRTGPETPCSAAARAGSHASLARRARGGRGRLRLARPGDGGSGPSRRHPPRRRDGSRPAASLARPGSSGVRPFAEGPRARVF
jgi:hypothetical protein